jgi:hypothetical protein
MASLTIPISLNQLMDLARQLAPHERRALLDTLLAERFEATLSESDRRCGARPELTDEDLQAEVDAVRQQRQEGRNRAAGG